MTEPRAPPPDRAGARVLDAGDGQPHVVGSTQRGGRAQLRGPRSCLGDPAITHGVTVVVDGSGRDPGEHVSSVTRWQPAAPTTAGSHTSRPMSATTTRWRTPVRAPEHEARLERKAKVTVLHRGERERRHGAGPARDPDGCRRARPEHRRRRGTGSCPGTRFRAASITVGRATRVAGRQPVAPSPAPRRARRGGDPTVPPLWPVRPRPRPGVRGPAHPGRPQPGPPPAARRPMRHLHRLGGRGVDRASATGSGTVKAPRHPFRRHPPPDGARSAAPGSLTGRCPRTGPRRSGPGQQ